MSFLPLATALLLVGCVRNEPDTGLPPPPAPIPASQRANLELVERMCQLAVASPAPPPGELSFGCACCAPFDKCRPQPGTPPVLLPPIAIYRLRHWHTANFVGGPSTQLSATFEGCEPGSENRGGTMLYDEVGTALVPRTYHSGINPDACLVLARSGNADALVCQRSRAMGSTAYTTYELVDLSSSEANVEEIAQLDDDGACLLEAEPYVNIEPGPMVLRDVDTDGDDDLVLDAKVRSGTLTEAQLATCTDETRVPTNLPPAQAERMVFTNTDGHFSADQRTRRLLDDLYRARDAHRAVPRR